MSARAASTSDARKRKAEEDEHHCRPECVEPDAHVAADLPPVLPDASSKLAAIRELVEPLARQWDTGRMRPETFDQGVGALAQDVLQRLNDLTPPPVPRAPWEDISTDRENPTLAKVTWAGHGGVTGTFAAEVYCYEDLHGQACVGFADGHNGTFAVGRDFVTSVTLLHTFDPSVQVPVDRALIEALRGARDGRLGCPDVSVPATVAALLAALADGAEKGAES